MAGLLLLGQQLHNNLTRGLGQRDDHMHGQRVVIQPFEPRVVAQGRELVAARAQQCGLQMRGLCEAVQKVGPDDRPAGNSELIFKRCIGKQDDPIAAHHGHQRCQ